MAHRLRALGLVLMANALACGSQPARHVRMEVDGGAMTPPQAGDGDPAGDGDEVGDGDQVGDGDTSGDGDAGTTPDVDGGTPGDGDSGSLASDAGPMTTSDAGMPAPLPIDFGDLDRTRFPVEDWRDTQFKDPGGWTTLDVTEHGVPANDASVDAAAKINALIKSTSGRRRLFFPAGTYSFKSSLTVSVGDIWFDGEGADKTVFSLDMPAEANGQINFNGRTAAPLVVTSPIKLGAETLSVSDAATLEVGDVVQLFADDAPLVNGGDAWSLHLYAQMLRITKIEGNELTLDMKVLLDYPAALHPKLLPLHALEHVKLTHFKVQRALEPKDQNVSNLSLFYTDNALVDGVESSFSGRNHIYFQGAKDCVITNNYVHDCYKHQTGGYGYGYSLTTSTGCRISNNKSARIRHQIILQTGANHNVVSYNQVEVPYDYNDVALHATWAYFNLFEGNTFQEGVADSSKDGTTVEFKSGPGNTWFRNYAVGRILSAQKQTTRQNAVGNLCDHVETFGSDHYVEGNLTLKDGKVAFQTLSASAHVPASLYLHQKPDFFAESDAWPVFGPGVANYGVHNTLPVARAHDLLQNAGFESGLGSWGQQNDVFSSSNALYHGGKSALKAVGNGAWPNVNQTISVKPNTEYTWVVWGSSSTDGARLRVLGSGNTALCALSSVAQTPSTYAWQKYFCNFNSGANTKVRTYIGVTSGTHYFDDAQAF